MFHPMRPAPAAPVPGPSAGNTLCSQTSRLILDRLNDELYDCFHPRFPSVLAQGDPPMIRLVVLFSVLTFSFNTWVETQLSRRDERGNDSVGGVVMIVGIAVLALAVVTAIGVYVKKKLTELP